MKRILLIGTGGTIASEMTPDGLAPELQTSQLLNYVPELSARYLVESIPLLRLDSTNLTPAHWLKIAACVQAHYDEFDGFVITHGTDTMAYTAAALSYLIQNSPKPVVLTGAQKPIGFDTTDSKRNLQDAFQVAASGLHGVCLVFGGEILLGTRARKTHSKQFQAFSSINYPPLGVIQDGRQLTYLTSPCASVPTFYTQLETRVAILKLFPGAESGWLDYLFARNEALIIESFGVGGLPEAGGFHPCVRRWTERGRIVVLTTQVQNEGSDISVYQVGRHLKSVPGVLEAYDMTTEAVLAKLMWILAQTNDPESVRRMFYTPVACDLVPAAAPEAADSRS